MAERLKAAVLKTVMGVSSSGVRIPPSPPNSPKANLILRSRRIGATEGPLPKVENHFFQHKLLLHFLANVGQFRGDQRSQVALNNRQINDGYIILCVAKAKTDCTIEIGVESHDKLYRNPFLDPLEPHELKADIASKKEEKK